MTNITIYRAAKIITMNPAQPVTTHVAVRDGRILGTGDLDALTGWGAHTLDERFKDHVLMPGLIEGHAHTMEGTLWRFTYCGFFDRTDPDGKTWPGLKSVDAVLEKLRADEAKMDDPTAPLSGWSFDPIYLGNERFTRQQLDSVSTERPIGLLHASGHIMNVNTKALELGGMLRDGVNHMGVPLGEDGLPMGALYGPDAMGPVAPHAGFQGGIADCDEAGLRDFARLCVRAGVTTVTDLASELKPEDVDMMLRVTGEKNFPACVVPLQLFMGISAKDAVEKVVDLKDRSTDRLRLGRIKAIADGSIQGFSARLRWPGYFNGAENGLWYTAPEQLAQLYRAALKADVQVHTHTNGDEATQMVLDVMGPALRDAPNPDHRFTLQHCQLADAAQFRQAANLKMCVNLFANHHFYWGDEHYRLTVGPERALRMNACRTALESGVPMTIHSDAPITPLGPLFTAWCAATRQTASGRIQGTHERIDVDAALHAITLGAAYTLHMDGEVGSIEVGKRADFAVLESDPHAGGAEGLRDVKIWGTVQGGRIFAAAAA